MSKHTPGPWTYDPELNRDWTIRSQAFGKSDMMGDYRGVIVADVLPGHEQRKHAIAEADANARLIAAAPELLEAAKSALHEHQLVAFAERQREGCTCGGCSVLRQAIAKAEGR